MPKDTTSYGYISNNVIKSSNAKPPNGSNEDNDPNAVHDTSGKLDELAKKCKSANSAWYSAYQGACAANDERLKEDLYKSTNPLKAAMSEAQRELNNYVEKLLGDASNSPKCSKTIISNGISYIFSNNNGKKWTGFLGK